MVIYNSSSPLPPPQFTLTIELEMLAIFCTHSPIVWNIFDNCYWSHTKPHATQMSQRGLFRANQPSTC